MAARRKSARTPPKAEAYRHTEAESLMRPEVGTQPQFRKTKPPQRYRYDSSLSPALDWDGQNSARERAEALLNQVAALLRNAEFASRSDAATFEDAIRELIALSKPFLNWSGKAERLSFDVPTLPLFIHERLSTQAIIETLKGHKRPEAKSLFDFFADPQHSITDQILRAYEYGDKWVNRMILGDALVVMNSLLHYESLGGQVQMIYMDPPYGVKFGSNFQPFVRKRDVSHNDDEDFTREPEMVQAYRDTWECGLHSYLTYLRDRLLLCRELLAPSGSVFGQISDENLHHVREVMDEIFGPENFASLVTFRTRSPLGTKGLAKACDYLLWYHKNSEIAKHRDVFDPKSVADDVYFDSLELPDGTRRRMSAQERSGAEALPTGSRVYSAQGMLSSGRTESCVFEYEFEGKRYFPGGNRSWRTTREGMDVLAKKNRLIGLETSLRFVQYLGDFPYKEINNIWADTFAETDKSYVVQTNTDVIQRCLLMTTDPGDLVFDPTCGSGTTAYVAEQWGRRWITADVSRVPLALARQRLLTATFPWYTLQSDERGPAGGFVYKRKQNAKGEEVGGIVPHVTLKSIANNEPPAEEVLVDRPEVSSGITRVCGPFVVEATIPTAMDVAEEPSPPAPLPQSRERGEASSFTDRMLEILRKSPVLRLAGNQTVALKNIRPPAKSFVLNAESLAGAAGSHAAGSQDKPVAFVFGPENAAVSERLVYDAAKEANAKHYTHLYVIGFAIQPNARQMIEQCEAVAGIPATYVQATPDLLMGDLLKNMRSSQIFSVCGLPEIEVVVNRDAESSERSAKTYQVKLIGLDVFDPVTMENKPYQGDNVPAWFLDTDYNGRCFLVSQAFFPRTSAWDNLKKALKGTYEEGVWDHLAGTTSAPFEAGEHRQVAVKVIDDRGNELLVVKPLAANGSRRAK